MILFTPTANLPPTTALNTTDNTTFNTSTPTFYATGTDPEGDDVVYQLSFQNRWGYYQNPVSSNGITGTNAGQRRAVSFSPTITHKAKYIYNSLRVTGAPTDDLKLEIFSNGSSEPGSLLATASNTVSGTLLTTSQSIQRYDFSEPLTLSSGTTYWAVWSRTGSLDDANYFGVGGSTSASPDGQLARAWNGSAWTTATGSTGGDSDTAGGAARPANTNNAGYPGTNGTNGDGGGGGGGAGIGTSFAANIGGAGGTYGGGGGGSSATNGTAKAGGAGASGWTLIEWA